MCYTKNYFAQNSTADKNAIKLKKFDSQTNYKIFKPNSLVFDDLGWLWISGINLKLVNEEINNRSAIIQRYDGNRFYTVKVPFFLNTKPTEIELIKRQDGKFYCIFKFKNQKKLFLLNPETLVFQEIKLPFSEKHQDICLFSYKNYFIVFLRSNEETKIYRLNKQLQFSLFNKKPIISKDKKTIAYFNNFIGLDTHFLVSDLRSGIYIYKENGDLLKMITPLDIGFKNNEIGSFLHIKTWFKKDNKIFISFLGVDKLYQYHPEKMP